MQKAVGEANLLLSEEKVLMGSLSNAKLYLVYVSVDNCRQEFSDTSQEQACLDEMFQRAVHFFSSGCTCCLAKRNGPFPQPICKGHLEGGVCFCQFVCLRAAEQRGVVIAGAEWEAI